MLTTLYLRENIALRDTLAGANILILVVVAAVWPVSSSSNLTHEHSQHRDDLEALPKNGDR